MGFEIDYLPVGTTSGEKSGDAIAMRFWDETPDDSFVMTVDGGTRNWAAGLAEHIRGVLQNLKSQFGRAYTSGCRPCIGIARHT